DVRNAHGNKYVTTHCWTMCARQFAAHGLVVGLGQYVYDGPLIHTISSSRGRGSPLQGVGGCLAFRLRRRSADGVWLGRHLAMPRGPDMRELRAEKHDEGRVIHPHEEYHQGACRAVGRAHACLAQVKTDGRLAKSKEQ